MLCYAVLCRVLLAHLLEVVLLGDAGAHTTPAEDSLVHGGGGGIAHGVKAGGEVVHLLIPA